MTDITIPPEALEAAARAIVESLRTARRTQESQDGYIPEARAAILAALEAWPGMKTPTEQWARDNGRKIAPCIMLPLPQETSDE